MNKEETARLAELKARIWREQALNLLRGKSNADEIEESDIENNRGRIAKALRLLDTYVTRFKVKKNQYGADTVSYRVHGFDESQALGTEPAFTTNWREIYNDVMGREGAQTAGYRSLTGQSVGYNQCLLDTEVLWVYWHKDEYDIVKDKEEEELDCFPRALNEARIKSALRAIVEEHFQTDFHSKVERYLGLPADTIKEDDTKDIKFRNFAADASWFTDQALNGSGGFIQEYAHYQAYFDALLKRLNDLNTKVQAAGGFAAVVKEMRKESIQAITRDVPVNITNDPNQSFFQNELEKPELNEFIMEHSEFFDYDTLYGSDASIDPIKSNLADPFEPDADEQAIITSASGKSGTARRSLVQVLKEAEALCQK